MQNNIKTIASLGLGIPAAIIACGESEGFNGFVLQLIALAVLGIILAANGLFGRKGAKC